MAELYILLLIMHMIADFVFQDNVMCRGKFDDGLCGVSIYKHAFRVFYIPAILFTVIAMVGFGLQGIMSSAIVIKSIGIGVIIGLMVAVPHLMIDATKSWIEKFHYRNTVIHDSRYEIFTFVGDQLIHYFLLFLTAVVITKWIWQVPPFIERMGIKNLLFILMFIVCGPPANILTRRILLYRHILKRTPNGTNEEDDEEPKTGQLIGSIERRLIIFFMFIDKFMAIGFLITAKSILRFNDIKLDEEEQRKGSNLNGEQKTGINLKGYLTDRSEYVLVGTFISVSIAVFCGYIALKTDNSDVIGTFYRWLIGVFFKQG